MPALPSLFSKGRKKAGPSRSALSYLRGEPLVPTPPAPVTSPITFLNSDVIDINDRNGKYESLDFDGGKPIDEYENDIIDVEGRQPTPDTTSFPRVQLDIDLSSPEGLSDWFESKFRKSGIANVGEGGQTTASGSGLRNEPTKASFGDGSSHVLGGMMEGLATGDQRDDNSLSTSSSEDVLANIQAMDPSHFGKMPGFDSFNRLDHSNHPYKKASPKPITIPKNQNGRAEAPSAYKASRPLSPLDTPISSSVSGTTLARALLSNTFVLPNDSRSSKYRSGMAGLTRSDSTTLPRSEHSFGGSYNDQSFSIGPDAPPIPSGAELLYQPPKKPRKADEWRNNREQRLKRRSSTGSFVPKALPETPSTSSRPISALLSPGVEFDMNSFIPTTPEPESEIRPRKPPSTPRSPLPPTPKLPYLSSEDSHSFKRESMPDEYQVATQNFPLDSELISPDLSMLSPAGSFEGPQSAKNLDDVLNYYSIPESPDPQNNGANYRPMFSPISEESSSQLSPPVPYRSEKRESKRNLPMPVGARSPSNSGSLRKSSLVRGESVPSPRTYSRQTSLSSVAERPRSLTVAPSPTSTHSSASFASAGSDLLLPPPPLSTIFSRARSGSAPSPIKVVRDSKDINAYKITVSPRHSDTPTTEEGEVVPQEFPETPNLLSPILTGDANSASATMPIVIEGVEVTPMPTTPLSAALPRANSQQSIAQQILLNRAGTTVRHSRQTGVSKLRVTGLGPRPVSPSNRRLPDIFDEAAESPANATANQGPLTDTNLPDVLLQPSVDDEVSASSGEQLAGPSNVSIVADLSRSPSRGPSLLSQGSDSSSMYTPSSESSKSRMKTLPAIPVSPMPPRSPAVSSFISASPRRSPVPTPVPVLVPRVPSPVPEPVPALVLFIPPRIPPPPSNPPPSIPPPSTPPPSVPVSSVAIPAIQVPSVPPPPTNPPPSPTPSQKAKSGRAKLPLPSLTITQGSSRTDNTVAVNGPATGEDSPASTLAHRRDDSSLAAAIAQNTMPGQSQDSLSYKAENFTGRDSDIFRGTSLGSPPPYYQAVREAMEHDDSTPTTGFPGNSNFRFPTQNPATAGPSTTAWNHTSDIRAPPLARESSIMSQRGRMRPPLPAGPRRPSQIQMLTGFPSNQYRDRSGSVSSVGSNFLIQAARAREASPMFSPKFQTPPPKWRGYTMEAAKWTFTSAQLQAIVSRAIRQSAEASSIRLLRLEVLDNELPVEIQRLEASRTDLKSRFKVLVKRRNALVSGLFMYVSGDEDGSVYAPRMIEELKEVTINLDRLTEELHSLDSQLAHLDSLIHIHSGSALAMALRKLNTSFLKQVSENQALRTQIQTLEAERDEAWQQAEDVANEFDRINDKVESISSKRSSRISAVRKSSSRVSKAGLRTPSQRISQLSSIGSGVHTFGMTPRSPMARAERIPPVPVIPKQRPTTISTDVPLKSSAALSPNHYTPTSETRALAEAQDELYAMLGIANPERPLRRSLSFNMLSGGSSAAGSSYPSFPSAASSPDTPSGWRRSSLPGNSTLVETYNAMAADRNAVLATIDMLSSTD